MSLFPLDEGVIMDIYNKIAYRYRLRAKNHHHLFPIVRLSQSHFSGFSRPN